MLIWFFIFVRFSYFWGVKFITQAQPIDLHKKLIFKYFSVVEEDIAGSMTNIIRVFLLN